MFDTKTGGFLVRGRVVPYFEEFLCASLRLFAYFAVKKPLKQLTAKGAKNAKITQRLELRRLPGTVRTLFLFAPLAIMSRLEST